MPDSTHTQNYPGIIYPLCPHGSTNYGPEITACLNKIKCWEDMKDCLEPLTIKRIHHQHTLCLPSTPFFINHALLDWFITGIYVGFCLSEWAQEDHIHSHAQAKLTQQEGDRTTFLISDLEFWGAGQHCYSPAMGGPLAIPAVLMGPQSWHKLYVSVDRFFNEPDVGIMWHHAWLLL